MHTFELKTRRLIQLFSPNLLLACSVLSRYGQVGVRRPPAPQTPTNGRYVRAPNRALFNSQKGVGKIENAGEYPDNFCRLAALRLE
jgi:hypothetical protein